MPSPQKEREPRSSKRDGDSFGYSLVTDLHAPREGRRGGEEAPEEVVVRRRAALLGGDGGEAHDGVDGGRDPVSGLLFDADGSFAEGGGEFAGRRGGEESSLQLL